jgi:hypothetical protein
MHGKNMGGSAARMSSPAGSLVQSFGCDCDFALYVVAAHQSELGYGRVPFPYISKATIGKALLRVPYRVTS